MASEPSRNRAVWVYLINTALLTTHEIDSAFWHEWELFQLPGGIELFLVLNLVLLGCVMFGFSRVVEWAPGALFFSYVLAAMGVFAFTIHMVFLVLGYPQFRSAVSILLLVGTLVASLIQLRVVSHTRERSGGQG